jgi:hypothetical protein
LSRKEYESARRILEGAIAGAPAALAPRVCLSYVLLQEHKDLIAAERALRDVLRIDPNHEGTRRNLMLLLGELRQPAYSLG